MKGVPLIFVFAVDIDFVVDVSEVAKLLQPETDKLLNGL